MIIYFHDTKHDVYRLGRWDGRACPDHSNVISRVRGKSGFFEDGPTFTVHNSLLMFPSRRVLKLHQAGADHRVNSSH